VALRKLTLLRSPWLRASGNGGMKHRRHGASMCGSKHILKRASGLQRKAGAGARASVRSQSLGTHPCILLPWKRGSLSNSVSEDVQAPSKDGKLSNKTRTGRPRGPRATRCNVDIHLYLLKNQGNPGLCRSRARGIFAVTSPRMLSWKRPPVAPIFSTTGGLKKKLIGYGLSPAIAP
jgi:hypothetical protein